MEKLNYTTAIFGVKECFAAILKDYLLLVFLLKFRGPIESNVTANGNGFTISSMWYVVPENVCSNEPPTLK